MLAEIAGIGKSDGYWVTSNSLLQRGIADAVFQVTPVCFAIRKPAEERFSYDESCQRDNDAR